MRTSSTPLGLDERITRATPEVRVSPAETKASALGAALINSNAALRAAGCTVPGEAHTRSRLSERVDLHTRHGASVGDVLDQLSASLELPILFLSADLRGLPLGELSHQGGDLSTLLNTVMASIYGTQKRLCWQPEGPYVVISEVPTDR